MVAVLRAKASDVLVIDPIVGAAVPRVAASASELFGIAVEFPYVPIVFYVSNAIKALPLVAHFPTRERCDVLVSGVDDATESIGLAIESVIGASLVASLTRKVGLEGADVPSSMRKAIRQIFTHPRLFRTAYDVASAACMSRRSLDRWLARRGLVPAAELLQLARAFLAIRLDRDRLFGREEICMACGLVRSHNLPAFVTRTTGHPVDSLAAFTDVEIADWVAHRLYRRHLFLRQEDTSAGRAP